MAAKSRTRRVSAKRPCRGSLKTRDPKTRRCRLRRDIKKSKTRRTTKKRRSSKKA